MDYKRRLTKVKGLKKLIEEETEKHFNSATGLLEDAVSTSTQETSKSVTDSNDVTLEADVDYRAFVNPSSEYL